MMRIVSIAWREFSSTAMTKGFIIGAVVVPLILTAIIPLIIILAMMAKPPAVEGTVAVIDKSGRVLDAIRGNLTPEKIAERMDEDRERAMQMASAMAEKMGAGSGEVGRGMAVADAAVPPAHKLAVEEFPPDADTKAIQAPMLVGKVRDGGRQAIVIVEPDAVEKAPDATEYGGFQVFIRPKLDERVVGDLRWAVRDAIRRTRIEAQGMDPARLAALTTVITRDTKEVTETGERGSTEALTQMLPIGFMILLITSVMVGGQYLVTTTVEEKSNRVVEVLLSAVSSKQLMTGKILGQMLVGMVLLFVYSGLGLGAMAAFSVFYLVEPTTILYLFIFFLIAYFLVAATLAAVGSAVNDMREAQSLQTPVMMAIIIPYMLWFPISRDPNSWLAIILSMLPPMSPFVMMLRVTSTEPPPTWQVLLSIALGLVAVYIAVWAAAKVFRVGLLMYGKPPNFRTLIKWVRMA